MTPLRIAVESDRDWTELTRPDAVTPITRVRVGSLGEAARATNRSSTPVFVDVDVHLAASVKEAYAEYGAAHPGWRPGARVGTIVHPGTASTLANLLGDIAVTGVADGVTLRGPDIATLVRELVDTVAPRLGVEVALPA
ncbi:hypothetical protein [Gordonia humi]|uniref:Uncharacterized protein n=1 Tax=Gordonia humi TaxID=686429 RepID=A0A840F4N4_9ACTN|nr:hypothetical protein [Gordonia humi]MBB4136439.1 hypothetical protein [Gordonia humi]